MWAVVLVLLLGVTGYFGWQELRSNKSLDNYIREAMQQKNTDDTVEWGNVVLRKKISYLGRMYFDKLSFKVGGIRIFLSILLIDFAISMSAAIIVNNYTILNPLYVGLTLFVLIFLLLFFMLKNRRKRLFERDIPAALEILSSHISAGKSFELAHKEMVANLRDSLLKKELKIADNKIGFDSLEKIYLESIKRFPYKSYVLFAITAVSCYRGGSSFRASLDRISQVIYNDARIEKRKRILSGGARASIMVLAALPFVMLAIMGIINPKIITFSLNDPHGIYVIYYLLISEAIGVFISYAIYKRAK